MLRDETDFAKRPIYIGRTAFHHKDSTFTRIEPLAKATKQGWQTVENAKTLFPSEGLIFSFDHQLASNEKDYIILFTTMPNAKDGTDRFIVDEWCEPYEVIASVEHIGAEEQREFAVERGLNRGVQLLPQAIILIGSNKCIFPGLRNDDGAGQWTLSLQERLERLQVYQIPSGRFGATTPIAGRFFALPGEKPTKAVEIVNWQSPSDCIETLTKTLKRAEGLAGGEFAQISNALIRKLVATYQATDLYSGDERIEALCKRAAAILPKLQNSTQHLEDIISILFSTPQVAQRIDEMVKVEGEKRLSKTLQEYRDQLTQALQDEMSQERNRLEQLKQESNDASRRRDESEEELTLLRLKYDETKRDVDALASGAIGDLRKFGEGIRSVLNLSDTDDGAKEQPTTAGSPPWTLPSDTHAPNRITLPKLPSILAKQASAAGLDLRTIASVDVLARAGDIPILHGDSVELFLQVYGACLSGHAVYRMQLDPSILGLNDLWTDAQRQRLTPIGEAWKAAEAKPDICHLAVLEHVDSANLSDWYALFRSHFQRARPPNLIALATAGTSIQKNSSFAPFAIELPGTLKSASALLVNHEHIMATNTLLEGPLTDDLTKEERTRLTGLCVSAGEKSVSTAIRLNALARSVKCWVYFDKQYASLPEELLKLTP